MKYFTLAISFLTIFPAKGKGHILPGDLGRSSAWFPLIGVMLGSLIAGVSYVASLIFPPLVASGMTVAVWIGMTGGLHLDGLADCCDGMFHASDPERRLEIMKDPQLGSFGVIGLICSILFKFICIYSLPAATLWIAIPLATSTARWLLIWAGKQQMARPTGMGADFSSGITLRSVVPALVTITAVTLLAGWQGILIVLFVHLITCLIFSVAKKQLGGLTGDVLGLIVEISEIIVLLGFCVNG
jgi:adenosylcobinamide-GDP ribazoletransferase